MRSWSSKYFRILIAICIPAILAGCGFTPTGILPDAPLPFSQFSDDQTELTESGSPLPANDCLVLGEPSTDTHKALFTALNNFRINNGLEPLIYSERLEIAADAHVRDLYERGFFAHINPDGANPGKRALQAGFCHEYVGENIAAGQKSVQAAQNAWENSPSHRENMLQPAYRYAGVGFYQDPSGRLYWAQEMAYHLP
jgi:uncharacterized protein YkwD